MMRDDFSRNFVASAPTLDIDDDSHIISRALGSNDKPMSLDANTCLLFHGKDAIC